MKRFTLLLALSMLVIGTSISMEPTSQNLRTATGARLSVAHLAPANDSIASLCKRPTISIKSVAKIGAISFSAGLIAYGALRYGLSVDHLSSLCGAAIACSTISSKAHERNQEVCARYAYDHMITLDKQIDEDWKIFYSTPAQFTFLPDCQLPIGLHAYMIIGNASFRSTVTQYFRAMRKELDLSCQELEINKDRIPTKELIPMHAALQSKMQNQLKAVTQALQALEQKSNDSRH